MAERRQIFRKESLEKLSSPERLDQLLRIVRPQGWITLLSLGLGLALAIVWSVIGHVPVTANGTAILVHRKRVVPFQSPANGRLRRLDVAVGEHVEKDQVLGVLYLPELEKKLQEERSKLLQFDTRRTKLTELELGLAEAEKEHLVRQRELVGRRIENVRRTATERKRQSHLYIASQRGSIENARTLSGELGLALKERLAAKQSLLDEDRISRDQVVDARSRVIDNQLAIAQLAVRDDELNLREEIATEAFDAQMDLIDDLKIQLNDLALREMVITRRLEGSALDLTSEQQQIDRNIALLESQLEADRRILSPRSGEILEITTSNGEEVAIGHRLGKIEIAIENSELMALAYFPIKDGKKVGMGDKIRVSPATVQRERWGGIVGSVNETPSPYPVTVEAAANEIGDLEVARSLLGGEARIQVIARLNTDDSVDNKTGFEWTSGDGPEDVQITAGTTAAVRVTIEERVPITLILPFLSKFKWFKSRS
jgi:HlyD family secretion protein